jgi:flagellar hook protein FlgE
MLRSLFAGISGLRVNQTMLDVTGNNIANANNIGFKGSTTIFQDTLSQMLTGASAVSPPRGGTNPMQVGLGVQLAGISTNMNQGSAQTTGRATDLMIQGDGFFVIQRGGQQLYTRAGAFNVDDQSRLVTADGDLVRSVGGGPVIVDDNGLNLSDIQVATFANPMGLEKVGDTMYRQTASSGPAGAAGAGEVMGGVLEMSNVDLAQEFTNLIIAQRGFQANSRVITTSDQVLEDLVNIQR